MCDTVAVSKIVFLLYSLLWWKVGEDYVSSADISSRNSKIEYKIKDISNTLISNISYSA